MLIKGSRESRVITISSIISEHCLPDDYTSPVVRSILALSERKARVQLKLAPRRRRFRDGSELRCIYEAVRRAEIAVIHRIERFPADLEEEFLREIETPSNRHV